MTSPRSSPSPVETKGKQQSTAPAGTRMRAIIEGASAAGLDDGEDVARRILEPGDGRPTRSARDSLRVRPGRSVAVNLEADALARELIDGALHALDLEVQHRERRGCVIGLLVDEDLGASREIELQEPLHAWDVRDGEAE